MAQPIILGLEVSDFTDNVLLDLGVDVTWIERTKFIDNITGAPEFTEETPVVIQGVFVKRALRYNWNKEGLIEMGDAYVMVPYTVLIKKADHVIFDGEKYRVETVLPREPGGVKQYKSVILYKIEGDIPSA